MTLTGTIARDGKMADIRVAETNVIPTEGKDELADVVKRNLSSWRFAAAPHSDAIRLTYLFRTDASKGRLPPVRSPRLAVLMEMPDKSLAEVDNSLLKR